jgi:cephalosporin-C deacetylase-like acetyl esterase
VLDESRNRAVACASRVRCPLLIQVALADSVAAPSACLVAADRAPRAELVSYPIAHFDIYLGEPRERAVADQLDFLSRQLQRR